jgi:integrase
VTSCACRPACADRGRQGQREALTPGAAERSEAALIISKWAGHYDSSFTMKTYVHASDDDLKQGRQALAKIHRIV